MIVRTLRDWVRELLFPLVIFGIVASVWGAAKSPIFSDSINPTYFAAEKPELFEQAVAAGQDTRTPTQSVAATDMNQ